MKLFLEILWKNYLSLIQIFKVHIKIYNTGDFQNGRVCANEMAAVSIKCNI